MIKKENGIVAIKVKDSDELFGDFLVIADAVRAAAAEAGLPEDEIKANMKLAFELGIMSPTEAEEKIRESAKRCADELLKMVDDMFGGKK